MEIEDETVEMCSMLNIESNKEPVGDGGRGEDYKRYRQVGMIDWTRYVFDMDLIQNV